MPAGTFYLLDDIAADQMNPFFCARIAELWREYRSVRVWCADEQQALALDECLWQHPAEAFVPHNLAGEGPAGGAPVELCWPQAPLPQKRVAAHVVLTDQVPEGTAGARFIVDRVPKADAEKALARERYKFYRAQGYQLDTQQAQFTST